jgi:hypothetical protein
MSLKKRYIRGRVAALVALSALFVLGLEAPAFAVGPTTTAVSPTSGPDGCVVQITGSGYSSSTGAQTHVFFAAAPGTTGGTEATTKTIISDTEIWATSPDLTAGNEYVIRVDNLLGTGIPSTATFLNTTGAGACAPTITSFTPTCGVRGDVVKITGTNLLASGDGTGGVVEFAPYDTSVTPPNGLDATPTNPDISDFTTLQVTAPGSSTTPLADGPIAVTTFAASAGGRVVSTTLFQTPPPDCVPAGGTTHARSVSFKIKSTGKASGKVSSTEDPAFSDCVAAVPVKIQRKTSSGWKTVGKTTTSDTGSYAKKVKNPKGKQKFRALAPKVSLGDPVTDVCSKAKSAVRKV